MRNAAAVVAIVAMCVWLAPPTAARNQDVGYIPLFNGRDLSGWRVVGPAAWEVQDGELCSPGTGAGWLRTERQYRDFVLRLDYNMTEGGNSGVFIHSPAAGRCSRIGFEVQLRDDAGQRPRKGSTGAIYEILAPTRIAARPAREWNSLEVRCVGPRIQITLNGVRVVRMRRDDPALNAVADPAFRPATRRKVGFIGLQDHGAAVRFRNIRVKEIRGR